jgi:hypothetical protein
MAAAKPPLAVLQNPVAESQDAESPVVENQAVKNL